MLGLTKQGRCWTEFYKYIKRRNGNRESITAVKKKNGILITDSRVKAKSLSCYYGSSSVANVFIHKFNQQNRVNPSPLLLKL